MDMSVGQRLRKMREDAGLTLGQVSAYEDVSAQYLSGLELGKNSPNVWPLLAKLARRYNTTADYLLGLTDDPSPRGEESEIFGVFDRLSRHRQDDLLRMADQWLAEESQEFRSEWLRGMLSEGAEHGVHAKLEGLLDEDEDEPAEEA